MLLARLRHHWTRLPGKRLMGQSAYYLMINALAALGPLVLIPYLTHVLSPESYGVYGNFMAAVGVATVLLGLNMDLVVRRRGQDQPESLRKWIGAALTVMMAVTGGALLLLPWLHGWLAEASEIPDKYLPLMLIAGISTCVTNMVAYVATMRERLWVYGVLRLGVVGLFVVGSIGLYEFGRGVVGDVMLARTLSLMAMAGLGLWWLHRQTVLGLRADMATLKPALRYGVLLMPALFFDASMTLMDRLTLTSHLGGLSVAGHYALAYQLAQPLQLVASSMGVALFPAMVRWFDAGTPADRKRLMLAGTGMLLMLSGIWLVYVLALPMLMRWLGATYAPALPMVLPLALCFVIGGVSTMVANRYFHSGETWWISVCCLLGLSVNAMGNMLATTPQHVVITTVAGYAVTGIWLGLGLFMKQGKRVLRA